MSLLAAALALVAPSPPPMPARVVAVATARVEIIRFENPTAPSRERGAVDMGRQVDPARATVDFT